MIKTFFMTNSITLVSIFFTILILIILFIKKKNNKIANKVYFYLILTSTISMILNIVWGTLAPINPSLCKIFMKIFTFMVTCWNYLLTFYVSVAFKTDEENETFYKNHNKISYVIGTILVLINLLATILLDSTAVMVENSIFYANGAGGYIMKGTLATFQSIVGAITLLYTIGIIICYFKKIDVITKILCLIAIILCGTSIGLKLGGLLVQNDTSFLHAVVIMFLFLSIESQDKALLAEFIESNKKAQESNKLKNEFITNMSHQLRTPMNTILGFSDSLLNNESLNMEILQDDVENIENASKILLELINSIFDISKIESNKEILNEEEYSMDAIIYDISSHINSKIDKDNLVFTINADENCPNDLYGDGYKLCKILNIILSNALKHTNYGEVSLNISFEKKDKENYEFIFHIKNSGHSMKVEDFNRDFENLIKLKSDEKNNIDAEILKMIIAKSLIELMNGTIEFINEENKGTQYIIKIKQKITSENVLGNIKEKIQLDNSIRTQIIDLTNKNALIIDDKKINSMLLKTLLNKNNINIETIEKNYELNENILDKKYDLIFVNYESETINSNDIINKLKISKSKDAPIVSLVLETNEINKTNIYDEKLICPIEYRELNKIIMKLFG